MGNASGTDSGWNNSSASGYANGGHVGALRGNTGGRADELPMAVPSDSHVIPADVVSSLGDGNTEAGFKILEKMFPDSRANRARGGGLGSAGHMPKMGGAPKGVKMPHIPGMTMPHIPGAHMSTGGDVGCRLSDGEFVVSPPGVAKVGNGNMDRGHRGLDAFILHVRKMDIERRKHLPGPVQS